MENIFINALYDHALKEKIPTAAWHAYLRCEMPSPPSSPPRSPPPGAAPQPGDGARHGAKAPGSGSLGILGVAQLQRWSSRSRHASVVRRRGSNVECRVWC